MIRHDNYSTNLIKDLHSLNLGRTWFLIRLEILQTLLMSTILLNFDMFPMSFMIESFWKAWVWSSDFASKSHAWVWRSPSEMSTLCILRPKRNDSGTATESGIGSPTWTITCLSTECWFTLIRKQLGRDGVVHFGRVGSASVAVPLSLHLSFESTNTVSGVPDEIDKDAIVQKQWPWYNACGRFVHTFFFRWNLQYFAEIYRADFSSTSNCWVSVAIRFTEKVFYSNLLKRGKFQ